MSALLPPQEGIIFMTVCQSVSLFVNRITQTLMAGFVKKNQKMGLAPILLSLNFESDLDHLLCTKTHLAIYLFLVVYFFKHVNKRTSYTRFSVMLRLWKGTDSKNKPRHRAT